MSHNLTALKGTLGKAAQFCADKEINEDRLLNAGLAPDMFNLTKQVQTTCDFGMRTCARLAGDDLPSVPDVEASFAELQARIDMALSFMATYTEEKFENTADKIYVLQTPGGDLELPGHIYITIFALQNFYFHSTTAYNILRHNGIELNKFDFMGR